MERMSWLAAGGIASARKTSARAFRKAARHSRLVALLRKGLPVFALLVLASYFITSKLSVSVGDMTASIDGIEVSDGNLRMTNPKLEGADKKNGKYSIGAEYADQDMKAPHRIKLHAMRAELEECGDAVIVECTDAVDETHGFADVPDPIRR